MSKKLLYVVAKQGFLRLKVSNVGSILVIFLCKIASFEI